MSTDLAAVALRRRVLIIVNPAAGGTRLSRRRLGRVVAALERRGCGVTLRRTGPRAGDAERLAREAAPEVEVIVAAGGDGTLNAVANGMAGAPPRPLAVLPLGTANVLAGEIGLPRDPEALAALIAAGPARPIWPGIVGDRLFLTVASSGFDAEIVAAVDPRLKRRVGRLAFAWAIIGGLWHHRGFELVVRTADAEYRAVTVIAAKSRRYAGRYVVAPRADLGEPILDLMLFQRGGRLAVIRYLAALLRGHMARRDDIVFLRSREATVSAAEPYAVQADGEIVGHLPMVFGVAERPLLLIRP